jgi:hypothetical protein
MRELYKEEVRMQSSPKTSKWLNSELETLKPLGSVTKSGMQ